MHDNNNVNDDDIMPIAKLMQRNGLTNAVHDLISSCDTMRAHIEDATLTMGADVMAYALQVNLNSNHTKARRVGTEYNVQGAYSLEDGRLYTKSELQKKIIVTEKLSTYAWSYLLHN